MTEGRPQDQGRSHRRRGAPSAPTSALLVRYQDAMRAELAGVLVELEGSEVPRGLTDPPDKPLERRRPPIGDRVRLWDLAIKIARELGTEVDVAPVDEPGPTRRPRARRVDYG